jgi:hypothetical protein
MRGLYKFHWDCGRQGDLRGIFTAEAEEAADLIGKEVYFGEVLGKHSEIYGVVEKDELTLLTEDQSFVAKFDEFGCASGFNPIVTYREAHEEREAEKEGQ